LSVVHSICGSNNKIASSFIARCFEFFHFGVVRACRNAIEFNQIPSIAQIVPGGREHMKLDVLLAVPARYQMDLDFHAIRQCFPYGTVRIQLSKDGGMIASNGKMITEMGDTNDDMIIVCVAVTVGY
jgi:uncharacterized protein (TIGR02058 family)